MCAHLAFHLQVAQLRESTHINKHNSNICNTLLSEALSELDCQARMNT